MYFSEFSDEDLSKIVGENDMGEDVFRSMVTWLVQEGDKERAEKLLAESGRFEKVDGRWSEVK